MTQTPHEFASFMILGGGQHAYLINSLADKQGLKIIGWLDQSGQTKFSESGGFSHLTKDSDYLELSERGVGLLPGIASYKLWKKRTELINLLVKSPHYTPDIIDERASISKEVQRGTGNQFIGNCFIQDSVQIGNWSIFNSGSIVEHDAVIGDFVHIAPGTVVCGGVTIGNGSYIGAGSTIIEGVAIGENVLIGAGSLVLRDVAAGEIQYGAPSKGKGNYNE